MKSSKIIIWVILATFAIEESNGIKCYDCQSSTRTENFCNDPFKSTESTVRIVDCGASCVKVTTERNGTLTFVRSCAAFKTDDMCGSSSGQGINSQFCTCNTDKCNTATTSALSMTTMIFMAAGTTFYSLFY